MTNSLQSIKLFYYVTKWDHVVLACELMLTIFVIYYTLEDFYECIVHVKNSGFEGTKKYLFNTWNLIDRTVLYVSNI